MVLVNEKLVHLVEIPAGHRTIHGLLHLTEGASGVVVFAHGSGSGRYSPRNQSVARELQAAGLATLLLDLLEDAEAEDGDNIFNVELMAERLQSVANWLNQQPETVHLPLGYFGASTGAGAALVAAARDPVTVQAIVLQGGRTDLAADLLDLVQAPTLLIVGGNDNVVLDINQQALGQLRCLMELAVVPGATHLFPEPGALEAVARLAQDWFVRYLAPCAPDSVDLS